MYSRIILIFQAENYMTQPVLIISMKTSFCCWNVSSTTSAHSRNWSTMFAFFYNFPFWLGFSIALSSLQAWSKANATLCPPESHTTKNRSTSHRHIPLPSAAGCIAAAARSTSCAPLTCTSQCHRESSISTNTSASHQQQYVHCP